MKILKKILSLMLICILFSTTVHAQGETLDTNKDEIYEKVLEAYRKGCLLYTSMYDKYMNQTEENQPEDSKNEDLNIDSGDNNNTATPDSDTTDEPQNQTAVSYTHLDVYKRQSRRLPMEFTKRKS